MDDKTVQEAPAVAPANTPAEAVQPANNVTPPPQRKKKVGLIVGIIAAVLIVLLGTGSVLAYNLWYQNPQKTLADAVTHALKAKTVAYTGEFKLKNLDSTADYKDATVTVKGKHGTMDGSVDVAVRLTTAQDDTYNVAGSGLYDKDGNLFFKVDKLEELVDSVIETSGSEMKLPESFDNIIKKVDGNWVRISADDLKEYSKEYADMQTCTRDALKKFEGNKKASDEIADLYRKHQFVTIKEELGVKDGNVGYVLDSDRDAAKEFVKGLKDTEIYKELAKCDEDISIDEDDITVDEDSSSDVKTRFEVWISRVGHELREVRLGIQDDEAKGELSLKPTFNAPVSIESPKDFIPLKELQKDIEKAVQELYGGQSDPYSSSLYDDELDYSMYQ